MVPRNSKRYCWRDYCIPPRRPSWMPLHVPCFPLPPLFPPPPALSSPGLHGVLRREGGDWLRNRRHRAFPQVCLKGLDFSYCLTSTMDCLQPFLSPGQPFLYFRNGSWSVISYLQPLPSFIRSITAWLEPSVCCNVNCIRCLAPPIAYLESLLTSNVCSASTISCLQPLLNSNE